MLLTLQRASKQTCRLLGWWCHGALESYDMAQPAWVVRNRRARFRRRVAPAVGRGWPAGWGYRVQPAWLRYFSHALHSPQRRSVETARAALAARAVLEGTSPEQFPASLSETGVWAPGWLTYNLRALPLRFAAHIIAVAIVLSVALLSSDLAIQSWPSVAREAFPGAFTEPDQDDVRVQRQITVPPSGQAVDLALAANMLLGQIEPAFVESHVLAEGETLGQIAAANKVSVASIVWSNDLPASDVFAAGQELRIPRLSGIPYVIEQDATLDSIAAQFHVSPQAIVLFKANGVQEGQPLPVGREIFIPGGTRDYPAEFLAQHNGEQELPRCVR